MRDQAHRSTYLKHYLNAAGTVATAASQATAGGPARAELSENTWVNTIFSGDGWYLLRKLF